MKQFYILLYFMFFFISIQNAVAQKNYLEWRQMNSSLSAYTKQPGSNWIFAGDEAGLIRKTNNKGKSWQLISSLAENRINHIAFLTSKVAIAAVARQGFILKTEDGGISWKQIQFMDTTNKTMPYRGVVKKVVVIDSLNAYLDVYNHPISGGFIGQSIVTRDGGKTFQLTYGPGNIFHVSGDTLIAFGREVGQFNLAKFTTYKSVDKGITWTIVQTSPTGFQSPNDFNNHGMNIAFFLNSKVFFINANKDYASDKFLYKTTDGGLTFSIVSSTVNAKFDYIYFKNALEGIGLTNSSGPDNTFYTSNGGTSWTAANKKVFAPGLFLSNDTLLAQITGRVVISTDFGKTWTDHSAETAIGTSTVVSNKILYVLTKDIAYANIGKFFELGVGNRTMQLVKTTDGGFTWNLVKDANSKTFDLIQSPYYFISPDTFFFMGTGYAEGSTTQGGYLKIKYTTDGGKTHVDRFTGLYMEYPKELIFIDKKHGVTYADNGWKINLSTDSGKTWTKLSMVSPGGGIKNIEFPSLNNWYILSTLGKIYQSTDMGTTFTEIYSGAAATNANEIYFLDDSVGFIYSTSSKKYFKTTNGSKSWTEVSSGFQGISLNNTNTMMAFQNKNIGYLTAPLANGSRAITRTTDAGLTWDHYIGVQGQVGAIQMDFKDSVTAAIITNNSGFIKYFGNPEWNPDTIRFVSTPSGVADNLLNAALKIYPNPAQDIINVECLKSEGSLLSVSLSDLIGNTVRSYKNILENKVKLSVTALPAGVYFLKVETSKGVATSRIVVQ